MLLNVICLLHYYCQAQHLLIPEYFGRTTHLPVDFSSSKLLNQGLVRVIGSGGGQMKVKSKRFSFKSLTLALVDSKLDHFSTYELDFIERSFSSKL